MNHIPGFTAESVLNKQSGHYRFNGQRAKNISNSILPQSHNCFCSEPDPAYECDEYGCRLVKWRCLQWFCPPHGPIDEKEWTAFK
nr:hypothetical protein [Nitrosomonas nitrosa]